MAHAFQVHRRHHIYMQVSTIDLSVREKNLVGELQELPLMSQGEFANVLVAYNVGFKLPGIGGLPTCELIWVITDAAET